MTTEDLGESIQTTEQLDELLSRPSEAVVDLFKRIEGPLAIVGGGGKIGPSLVSMACRARDAAGTDQEIVVVDIFPDPAVSERIAQLGAKAIKCDLLDPDAVGALPMAPNAIYMAGMKFGTTGNPALTWAVNGMLPAYVARHFRDANIVAFSTGCVYNMVPVNSGGSVESDPIEPTGEYSNSCVARERVLEYCSQRYETPMLLVRLNYAVEMRYGVIWDIAQAVHDGEPVDVTMGYLNAIWQGDVNAATLRMLEHTTQPASPINLTGPELLSVREIATRCGEIMDKPVSFTGKEADTALLSNSTRAHEMLGLPRVPAKQVIDWTARWVAAGGQSLGKPTHFQTRDGKY